MAIEPIYETINFNCEKNTVSEQIKVESKAIASDEVTSIINVSTFAFISQTICSGGKIEYGGKIIFYVCYLDAENNVKKCECGSEFKGAFKDDFILDNSKVNLDVVVDKAYCDTSNSKLVANAYLTVKGTVSNCSQAVALSGGENLIINANQITCEKSCGVKSSTYPIEEEFQLGYAISEVISHRAQAIITAVQCGVGAIIVDGEVLVSAIMLQNNKKNDIIKEDKTIPFRYEIECEDAMPTMQATARVKEQSLKTDVSVDQDNGVSVMSVSINLLFEGEAFYYDTVSVATDVFSTDQEIDFGIKNIKHNRLGEVRSCNCTVLGRVGLSDLPVGASVLAVGDECVQILKISCDEGLAKITGTLSAVAYMRDGENGIFSCKLETPFENQLDCEFACETDITLVAKAKNARARIVSLNEMELESEIYFTVYPEEMNSISVIGEVKVLGEKQKETSAISVYIPTAGEELWSLSKRLNVCPEKLVATNPELQFPLTGNERIVIYRQR